MPTLLCVPIKVLDATTALADAAAARDAGADLVEFRIDEFFEGSTGADAEIERDAVVSLVAESPLPCIVTCRPTGSEGGDFDGDEASRISLYERLAIANGDGEHPPRYIDIELATFERSANVRQKIKLAVDHPEQVRDLRTSLILSSHDFQGRPADLFRRVTRMRAEPAAVVLKIAYMARSLRDNLDLFDLLADADRPTIALAMGRFGLLSRVLAPKFGGFLTFASLRPATTTAPGQPTVADILGTYRFRSIRRTTRVYGVVGFPIEHSISPAVHNAGFDERGAWAGSPGGGVYLPLPIPPEYEHFKATILALADHPRLDFSGCSVTIPHKEHLVRLAREERSAGRPWTLDAASDACGAANTIAIERTPGGGIASCSVTNTDIPAAMECLTQAAGSLAGKHVGVLGAGGVARAIAYGALVNGAAVTVFARDLAKARVLAAELSRTTGRHAVAALLDEATSTACHAYVNCTPLGMKGGPAPDASALDITELATASVNNRRPAPVVMDTVYTPLETPLLASARAAGMPTVSGLGMFVRQAELQFRAWTGDTPISGLYEGVARRMLLGHQG